MSKSWSLGGARVGMETDDQAEEIDEKKPLKLVVIGDFSGRGSQRNAKPRGSGAIRAFAIDRDNFEQVLQHLNVRLDGVPVTPSGELGSVAIDSLGDFHPDSLLQRVASLRGLRELRSRLAKRETFVAAMEEAKTLLSPPSQAPHETSPPPAERNPPLVDGASLLDQILDSNESGTTPPPRRLSEIERYAQAMMAPYSIPADDPRQEPWLEAADQAVAFAVKQLLQAPAFKELEARWRSLDWLVRRVESDVDVKVAVIDLSEQELRGDLDQPNFGDSALYELLVKRPKLKPGESGWNAIVLDQRLTSSLADVEVLGKLSLIANACSARLLLGLTDDAVGCTRADQPFQPTFQRPAEAWLAVRQLPETKQTTLVWPGFLLRQPYGSKTSPVESLDIEELAGVDAQTALLFGNGAYLAAAQLIREQQDEPGSDYTGMPCVVLPDGSSKQMVPATGWWLRDAAIEHLNSIGVTTAYALPHAGALRLFPLRSFYSEENS